jgi:hypothetical protein
MKERHPKGEEKKASFLKRHGGEIAGAIGGAAALGGSLYIHGKYYGPRTIAIAAEKKAAEKAAKGVVVHRKPERKPYTRQEPEPITNIRKLPNRRKKRKAWDGGPKLVDPKKKAAPFTGKPEFRSTARPGAKKKMGALHCLTQFTANQENNREPGTGRFPTLAEVRPSYRAGRRHVVAAKRGQQVAQDLHDEIRGVAKDPKKKRFYEKEWFKSALIGGAVGAGILAHRHHAASRGQTPLLSARIPLINFAFMIHDPAFPIVPVKNPVYPPGVRVRRKPAATRAEIIKRLQGMTQLSRREFNTGGGVGKIAAETIIDASTIGADIGPKKKKPTKAQIAAKNADPDLVPTNNWTAFPQVPLAKMTKMGRVIHLSRKLPPGIPVTRPTPRTSKTQRFPIIDERGQSTANHGLDKFNWAAIGTRLHAKSRLIEFGPGLLEHPLVSFRGIQPIPGKPPLRLYNLKKPLGKHPVGSTVTHKTLEMHGHAGFGSRIPLIEFAKGITIRRGPIRIRAKDAAGEYRVGPSAEAVPNRPIREARTYYTPDKQDARNTAAAQIREERKKYYVYKGAPFGDYRGNAGHRKSRQKMRKFHERNHSTRLASRFCLTRLRNPLADRSITLAPKRKITEFYGTSEGVTKSWDTRGRRQEAPRTAHWWTHSPTRNSVRVVRSPSEQGPRTRRGKKFHEKTSTHKAAIAIAGTAAAGLGALAINRHLKLRALRKEVYRPGHTVVITNRKGEKPETRAHKIHPPMKQRQAGEINRMMAEKQKHQPPSG